MLMFEQHPGFRRFVSFVVLMSFGPVSVDYWNFLPRFVVTKAEASEQQQVPEPASTPAAALSDEVLKNTVGGPTKAGSSARLLLAKLPSPQEMGKGLPKSGDVPPQDNGNPLQVAQAPAAIVSADLNSRLASADGKRSQGRFAEATAEYLGVMNDSPRSIAARVACDGFAQVVKSFRAGEVSETELTALDEYVSNRGNLRSAEARWVAALTTSAHAQLLQAKKDAKGAQAENLKCVEIGLHSAKHDLDNALVGETLKHAYNSAVAIGQRDSYLAQVVDSLESVKPCIGSWQARFVVASANEGPYDHSAGVLQYASMIDEAPLGFLDAAFKDETVHPYIKATLHHKLGLAYYSISRDQEALEQFETVVREYPNSTPAEKAAYSAAYVKMCVSPEDPMVGLNAFYDYLKQYSNAPHSLAAWNQIQGIYYRFGDLDAAIEIGCQIIQQFPNTNDARAAEDFIAFLTEQIAGMRQASAESAKKESQTVAGAMCGPNSLRNLLQMKGIEATADELAALAHTDNVGTTMLGLMEAARAKGFELRGVQAAETSQLSVPFIAHINDNHFVVVTAVNEAQVAVLDGVGPERALSPAEFSAIWHGKALVAADSKGGHPLREMDLRGAKGGNIDEVPSDATVDCPNHTATDEDDCENDEETEPTVMYFGVGIERGGGEVGMPTNLKPNATIQTNVKGSGLKLLMQNQNSAEFLREEDLNVRVKGGFRLKFKRTFHNAWGHNRSHFVNTALPYSNNVGKSWSHNYNIHLQTSSAATPGTLVYYDEMGNPIYYSRSLSLSTASQDVYVAKQPSSPTSAGTRISRDTSTLKYNMTFPSGLRYQFSAATTDAYRYARLDAIDDTTYSAGSGTSQNRISLSYDGTGIAGRLTKVAAPSGDNRSLQFSYSGNVITKAELKSNTTVLQQATYQYDSNFDMTKVTDNDNKTIQHLYGSEPGFAPSQYISRITDKAGVQTNFTYEYAPNVGDGVTRAHYVTVDYADGLRTLHARQNTSTGISPGTVTTSKAGTALRKVGINPGWHNLLMSSVALYTDPNGTISKSWGFEYSGTDLTKITRPDGSVHVQYTYTPEHRVSTTVKPDGTLTTYDYASGAMKPTKMRDAAGLDTYYTYDQNNQVITVNTPGGGSADWVYARDTAGLVTSITDPLGHVTSKAYDARGQLTSSKDALNNETKFEYDDLGHMTRKIDPRNKSTYFYYATGGCGCGGTGMLTKTKDALNNETLFRYDQAGNRTKVIDALNRETDYAYDLMNRVTRITQPSGSSTHTTLAYDALGQLTRQTEPDGRIQYFYYDHTGRQTQVTDGIGSTYSIYTDIGKISTVTDGLSHTTDYDYDAWGSLTRVTYPNGKVTRYEYDGADRVTKTGAGSDGSVDPTLRYYDATTGRLSKIRFTSGATTHDGYYHYDAAARLTKLTDWLDATNGLRYAYDDANRLTRITDYDNATLTYAYDAAGKVTSMTDYHGNTTSYAYTDTGQLSTLTAPGSRTWDYDYNALGQSATVALPNGMYTTYGYDTRNRMTQIFHHVDATTTALRFDYGLDNGGKITHVNQYNQSASVTGSWDYGYDPRARLTRALRKDGQGAVLVDYAYCYDAGDNMLAKSEGQSFFDDFNDGNFTGWTADAAWSAADGYMAESSAIPEATFYRANTDPDFDLGFKYKASGSKNGYVYLRYANSTNHMYFHITGTHLYVSKVESGVTTGVCSVSLASATDVWYRIYIVCRGTTCTVWRATGDGEFTQVMSSNSAPIMSTTSLRFKSHSTSKIDFDDIQVIGSSLSTDIDTDFSYNAGNELTSQTVGGVTTNFAYDAWGRMTNKSRGSYSATYAWGQGDKLTAVTSNFPGEGNVTYSYGADKKRRTRNDGMVTKYRWTRGWNVMNEEDSTGALMLTLVGGLAEISGSNPATGTIRYTLRDNLVSLRALYGSDKTLLGSNEYTPYGNDYLQSGVAASRKFTGLDWDANGNLYYAPYRYYSPNLARWLSRDPLGIAEGLNVYAYVGDSPTMGLDPLGLGACGAGDGWGDWLVPEYCLPFSDKFTSACQAHDDCYGGCNNNKDICDLLFAFDMLSTCGEWDMFCKICAMLYYEAVDQFGGGAYDSAQDNCDCD